MTATQTTETDQLFDTADAISAIIEEHPDRLFTPSALFRRAAVRDAAGTRTVLTATLRWMVEHDFVMAEGNGAWQKYRTRRAGERNAR